MKIYIDYRKLIYNEEPNEDNLKSKENNSFSLENAKEPGPKSFYSSINENTYSVKGEEHEDNYSNEELNKIL
jgi:hypothetical protein